MKAAPHCCAAGGALLGKTAAGLSHNLGVAFQPVPVSLDRCGLMVYAFMMLMTLRQGSWCCTAYSTWSRRVFCLGEVSVSKYQCKGIASMARPAHAVPHAVLSSSPSRPVCGASLSARTGAALLCSKVTCDSGRALRLHGVSVAVHRQPLPIVATMRVLTAHGFCWACAAWWP